MSGLIVLFWFVAGGIALRYFVLFIGVMSDLYVLWDIIDDTIEHKANGSDASAFAEICGCFPSQGEKLSLSGQDYITDTCTVWGVIWLLQALIMFGIGLIVGIVAFKVRRLHCASDTEADDSHSNQWRSRRSNQNTSCRFQAQVQQARTEHQLC
jgi:hypothetical protein